MVASPVQRGGGFAPNAGGLRAMSIVRIGLSESRDFGEGWDAIFGKGKDAKQAKLHSNSKNKKKVKHPAKKKK
jgi:hypothetical protein